MQGRRRSIHRISFLATVLCAIGAGAVISADAGHKTPVDVVLVLAVDVSNSINEEEARLQRFGYVEAIADPQVIAAIEGGRYGRVAIAYIEWAGADEQQTVVGWTLVTGADSARALSASLARRPIGRGYWTSISGAIDYAAALIADAPFHGTRRVIDLSSDGRNNAGMPLAPVRSRTIARGITINGLAVLMRRHNFTRPPIPFLDRYFEDCVIGGPGSFVEVAESYRDFPHTVRRKLVREIAGLSDGRPARFPAADVAPPAKPNCGGQPPRAEAGPTAGPDPHFSHPPRPAGVRNAGVTRPYAQSGGRARAGDHITRL